MYNHNLIEKNILVVGHPRSGTGYMAKTLSSNNILLGHECMNRDGISSWMFAARSDKVPYTSDNSVPSQYIFDNIIHVVRNPLDVIASMAYSVLPDDKVLNYMENYIYIDQQEDHIVTAVRTWIGWNRLISALHPNIIIQVERAFDKLESFLDVKLPIRSTSKKYNTRKHKKIDAKKIRYFCGKNLFTLLEKEANIYGYML